MLRKLLMLEDMLTIQPDNGVKSVHADVSVIKMNPALRAAPGVYFARIIHGL